MTCNLVLSGGPTHDFAATTEVLVEVFEEVAGLPSIVVADPADAVDALRAARNGGPAVRTLTVNALRWSMEQPRYAEQREAFGVRLPDGDLDVVAAFVRDGGGMLAMHTAVICFDAAPAWRDLCGAAWVWDRSSHPAEGPVSVRATDTGRVHPLAAGVDDFVVDDELYGDLDLVDDVEPLLVGTCDGGTHPVLWAREVGEGRVVTDLLGHGPASLRDPSHRAVLARAAAWISGGPS